MRTGRRIMAVLVAMMLLFSGCGMTDNPGVTGPTTVTVPLSGKLTCVEISRFSGRFVENGKDQSVQDVAAIRVENGTERFLDLAVITYQVGDRTLEFRVTGLPSGRQAWVLESSGQVLKAGEELELLDCQESYNSAPITTTNQLAVSRQGNTVSVTNNSGKDLANVTIYYKNTMEGGIFFGGITYVMSFGNMKAGEAASKSADHFGDTSEIVRFSYQS